ncbi:hypothetical protein [Mesorhizobium sp. CN2-181]|uniref:hypothetical protein n=1 Tax=Mesorhizobium yinganensis TaxID=3157707 RepID=UPI0032B76C4A
MNLLQPPAPTYPWRRPKPDEDVLWRAEGKRYSYVIDADSDHFGTTPLQVEMHWYPVTKRTPCGAWIGDKFVRLTARKRWACNTEKEALESYAARKKRQISIYEARLVEAKRGLTIAEHAITKENP